MSDDGTMTYAYDALNRLIKVTRKSDSAVMAEYAYDALGRRIWRKADEDQSGSQETELYYVHDGQREIEERAYSDEDLKRDYVYGNYIDEPIFARSDNNNDGDFADSKEQFYYCHNNLYNVAVLLDTSGNIIEAYAYKPYGNPTIYTGDGGDGDWFDGDETTGPLTGNYYLFTGRRYDPESELFYYRERYYSPELGRFISRDPIFGLMWIPEIRNWLITSGPHVLHLYVYCFNSPINLLDSLGLLGLNICSIIKLTDIEKIDGKRLEGSQICELICDMTANQIYYMTKNQLGKEIYNSCKKLPECHRRGELIITGTGTVGRTSTMEIAKCKCEITLHVKLTTETYEVIK